MNYYEEPSEPDGGRPRRNVTVTVLVAIASVTLLLGFALGVLSGSSLDDPQTPALFDEELVASVYERANPAVVEINVDRGLGELTVTPITNTGSGFLVDGQGRIVTNNHVIDGARSVSVELYDGRTLTARVLGNSPADDLALLQVDVEEVSGIEPLTLADSDEVSTGQMAIAIGSPFRQMNSVSVGIVSGKGRGLTSPLRRPMPNMIQVDTPLNPGNSGGPLLNSRGEVIGVNSSVSSTSVRGVGEYRIGYAVPSNTVRSILPDLLIAQQVRRPWLGISGLSADGGLIESDSLPHGVYVTRVFENSPAARAGLVPFATLRGSGSGDVITAIDGEPVDSMEGMVSYFNDLKPGATVTLSVYRDRATFDVDVTLAPWPDA